MMTSPAVFYADPHIGLKFRVRNAAHTTPLGHSGQDINGWSEGTWIPNFAAGVIVRKVLDEDNPGDLGNFIVIECRIGGDRYFITHCHLASFGGTKGVGEEIKFGEGIGPIGNTGYSKGTHDHIMASKESMYPNARVWLVDPLPLILACRAGTAGGGTEPIPTPPKPVELPEEDDMKLLYITDNVDGNGNPGWILVNTQTGKYLPPLLASDPLSQERANSWARVWGSAPKCVRQDLLNMLAAISATKE